MLMKALAVARSSRSCGSFIFTPDPNRTSASGPCRTSSRPPRQSAIFPLPLEGGRAEQLSGSARAGRLRREGVSYLRVHRWMSAITRVFAPLTPAPSARGLARPRPCDCQIPGRSKPVALGPPPSRGRGKTSQSCRCQTSRSQWPLYCLAPLVHGLELLPIASCLLPHFKPDPDRTSASGPCRSASAPLPHRPHSAAGRSSSAMRSVCRRSWSPSSRGQRSAGSPPGR